MKIDSKDISVVVQGLVSKEFTPRVLKSIRKYLPKAEIILSTWEGTDCSDLDYDQLILNKDPGAEILFPQWNQYHNLNRQIVSTKAGINTATRKYLLKTRTDIIFESSNFLKYFLKFKKRNPSFLLFKERILLCEHYVRRAEIFPYHFSDWVQFGLKEDLEKLWDIPLAPEPETTKWFYSHTLLKKHLNKTYMFNYFRHRYCAEQYILSTFIKKYIPIKFEHMWDITHENVENTQLFLANNTVILSRKQFGISFCKGNPPVEDNCYSYNDWQTLYKRFCDCKYIIKYVNEKKSSYEKYKRHINKDFRAIANFFILKPYIILNKILHAFVIYPIRIVINIIRMSVKYIKSFLPHGNNIKNKSYNKFFDKIIKYLPHNAKVIDIANSATGEAMQLAAMYDKYKNKGDFLITFRPKTIEIFKLFSKTTPIFIKNNALYFKDSIYFYKGKIFRIFFSDEFWMTFWAQKIHFIDAALQELNLSRKQIEPLHANYSKNDEENLNEKIKQISLNMDKFIFISPEANSVKPLSDDFWNKITTYLHQQGYDIFCNAIHKCRIKYVKSVPLSFAESYLLAKKSKAIIALRSGFIEMFLQFDIQQHIIYTQTISVLESVLESYTLKKYPGASKKIYEYLYPEKSEDDIFNYICKKLK